MKVVTYKYTGNVLFHDFVQPLSGFDKVLFSNDEQQMKDFCRGPGSILEPLIAGAEDADDDKIFFVPEKIKDTFLTLLEKEHKIGFKKDNCTKKPSKENFGLLDGDELAQVYDDMEVLEVLSSTTSKNYIDICVELFTNDYLLSSCEGGIKAGTVIQGNCRLEEKLLEKEIGTNSLCEIWKASNLTQERAGHSYDVIVKLVTQGFFRQHPDMLRDVVRECFVRSERLDHSNFVKFYNIGCVADKIFMVTESPAGIPLNKFIEDHTQGISFKEAEPVIKGIGDALVHVHKEGMAGLDVKPANIFWDSKQCIVKVCDFDIEQRIERSKTDSYMSVERILNSECPDPRDDIYALACVTYELLSGAHPFDKKNSTEAKNEKLVPKPIKALKPKQLQALLHGLDFERENRASGVTAFLAELFPAKKKFPGILVGVIALIFLIVMGYKPIKGMIDAWQERQLIEIILQTDETGTGIRKFEKLDAKYQKSLIEHNEIEQALVSSYIGDKTESDVIAKIERRFDEPVQNDIFKDENVRKILLTHYVDTISDKVKVHDFHKAFQLLKTIKRKYGDSIQLSEKFNEISYEKRRYFIYLENQYKNCMDSVCRTTTAEEIKRLELEDKTKEEVLVLLEEERTKRRNAEAEFKKLKSEEVNAETRVAEVEAELERVKAEAKGVEAVDPVKVKKMEAALIKAKADAENAKLKIEIMTRLQKCQGHLRANRLTTGGGGTALDCYRGILALDKDNNEARKGLREISDRYVRWTERALNRGQFNKAQTYLSSLERVNPRSFRLDELTQRLKSEKPK